MPSSHGTPGLSPNIADRPSVTEAPADAVPGTVHAPVQLACKSRCTAAPGAPSPEELRERAGPARDEADRLTAEIAELDVKLGD